MFFLYHLYCQNIRKDYWSMTKSELEVFLSEQGQSKRRYLYLGHIFQIELVNIFQDTKRESYIFYQRSFSIPLRIEAKVQFRHVKSMACSDIRPTVRFVESGPFCRVRAMRVTRKNKMLTQGLELFLITEAIVRRTQTTICWLLHDFQAGQSN